MTFKTLMIAGALSASLAAGSALAADVAVTLTGVKAEGGTMLVSLQSKDQFMKPVGAAGAMGPATAGTMNLTVEDVAPGEYAVMVMHDADSNWTMTMKDGKPAEGWGHSGAAGGKTFEAMKVTVPEAGAAVTVALDYPQ
ncbi:MAG: hypothetical protein K0R83_791 [Caulobacter sp.]|jgi:uncharacterized protein (DUF2141 family)|nr:hypothetical protein [Caulobacter sp.]